MHWLSVYGKRKHHIVICMIYIKLPEIHLWNYHAGLIQCMRLILSAEHVPRTLPAFISVNHQNYEAGTLPFYR